MIPPFWISGELRGPKYFWQVLFELDQYLGLGKPMVIGFSRVDLSKKGTGGKLST